jgi:hypothetical protein
MMTNREVELTLKLRDQATAVWNQFTGKVAGGAKEIGAHADQMGRLTDFVREQRQEQRMQNFLFREAKNVIGTVTFAAIGLSEGLGIAGKGMHAVNSALVTGYSTFQAANFAMSALGIATGGWGLAIQLVLGLGAGFLMFLKGAGQSAEEVAKQITNSKEAAQKFTEAIGGKEATKELAAIDKRIAAYREETKAARQSIDLIQKSVGGKVVSEAMEKLGLLPALSKLKEESGTYAKLTEQLQLRREVLLELIAAEEQEAEVKKRKLGILIEEFKQGQRILVQLKETTFAEIIAGGEFAKARAAFNRQFPGPLGLPEIRKMYVEIKRNTVEITEVFAEYWQMGLNAMNQAAMETANDLFLYFKGSIEGIKGLIGGLVQHTIDAMARLATEFGVKALFSLLASIAFPEIGFMGFFSGLTGIRAPAKSMAPITPGPSQGPAQVNFNIYAIDSRSVQDAFRKPENRRAIIDILADAGRKGIVGI